MKRIFFHAREKLKKNLLFNLPVYLLLLPVFFVLHACREYFGLVPPMPAFRLTIIYLGAAVFLGLLGWLLFRNKHKACLAAFLYLGYYFVFGSVQDLLEINFPGSILTRYVVILPASFILMLFCLVYLKKSSRSFLRVTHYLNVLLSLIVIIDGGWILTKIIIDKDQEVVPKVDFASDDTGQKPDIFFIVADNYPGNRQLITVMNFDNTAFEDQLRQRGFYVADSSISNYNYTFYSLGSLLNMNYLENVSGSLRELKNTPIARKAVKYSQVPAFFEKKGYNVFNYSIFEIKNHPAIAHPKFLIRDTRPITEQTFFSRIYRDIGFYWYRLIRRRPTNRGTIDHDLKNNELLYQHTIRVIKQEVSKPKFVYSHLLMPHHPYYYDSLGQFKPTTQILAEGAKNPKAFLGYLAYCNRKYLQLIDTILAGCKKPPIIVLVGDHGYREMEPRFDPNLKFLNLCAVHLPGRNYSGFYKGISNVNLFRVILNAEFRQYLPMLKDSTLTLTD